MTDKDFIDEVRNGLMVIMRAMIRKYGLGWLDFLPARFKPPAPVDVTESAPS